MDVFILAYLDDILIFLQTYDKHVEQVQKVLKKLQQKHLPVKLSKCEFHKHKIAFLGYLVLEKGLALDPVKI